MHTYLFTIIETPFLGLVPVLVCTSRGGSTGRAGGSCLEGLAGGGLAGAVPGWKGVGLSSGDSGLEGDAADFLGFLALFASCSSLVLKS